MVSSELSEELKRYKIGATLRQLRIAKKLGLAELGKHAGLSAGMLSKIERGHLYPTLPTLLRIARVFGVGFEYFLAESRRLPQVTIVRRPDRIALPERTDGARSAFRFESLDFPATQRPLHSFLATFEPIAASEVRLHQHRGVELIYVIEGTLILQTASGEHAASTGDAVYFDADLAHGYRSRDAQTCTAIVVTVP